MKTAPKNLSHPFRTFALIALAAFASLIAGCGPSEWVIWSPDGQHAIVDDGSARIVVPAGNSVAAPFAEGETPGAWLPDSRRVIVWRDVPAASWAEYATLLGETRAAVLAAAGEELIRLLDTKRDALADVKDSPALKYWTENLEMREESVEAALFYVDQTRPGFLDPFLAAMDEKAASNSPGKDEGGDRARHSIAVPEIVEMRVREALSADAASDQLILRSVDHPVNLAVSPSGRAVAFVRKEAADLNLYVMMLVPDAKPILVASGGEFAAWSPDGQDLAYSKSDQRRGGRTSTVGLGAIARRRVCTPEGSVIAEPEAAEDIAGLILPDFPARVAWLPDGRILFAGAKFPLPATSQNLPGGMTLFALRFQPQPQIDQLIPDSVSLEFTGHAGNFRVSPDGKNVAILGTGGAVSVLSLETNALVTLQDPCAQFGSNGSDDGHLVPTWRTADELVYLAPAGDAAGSARRAEVVIASLRGGKRAISKTWPDSPGLPLPKKP